MDTQNQALEAQVSELQKTVAEVVEGLKWIKCHAAGFPVDEPDDERFVRIEDLTDALLRGVARQ